MTKNMDIKVIIVDPLIKTLSIKVFRYRATNMYLIDSFGIFE